MSRISRAFLSFVDHWQFAATGSAVLLILTIVISTAQTLADVGRTKQGVEARLAHAIAEDHLRHYLADRSQVTAGWRVGGFASQILEEEVDGRSLVEIEVSTPAERSFVYQCEHLSGSIPRALRVPMMVRGPIEGLVEAAKSDVQADHEMPALAANVRSAEVSLDAFARDGDGFVRDDSIALLRLSVGTDRDDYRFDLDKMGTARPKVEENGWVIVPGNLWIDRGDEPLRIELARPTVIVVRGNCYVGSSVKVVGTAPLIVFVAGEAGGAESPAEGTGRLLIGNPGSDTSLRLAPSFVTEGDCEVAAGVDVIAEGALVVGGTLRVHDQGDAPRVRAIGIRLVDSRCRLAAIAATGPDQVTRLRGVAATAVAPR